MKVIHNAKALGLDTSKKVYTCTVCGGLFNWSDDSWWFGTLKQADEDPSKLIYCCSSNCKKIHKKNTLKTA